MMSFNKYLKYKQAESRITTIAHRLVENQQQQGNPATAQALDAAKQQLMTAFEQQFKSDPNGALTWLNALYTKVLPGDYKTKYAEFQKTQGQQGNNAQQGGQNNTQNTQNNAQQGGQNNAQGQGQGQPQQQQKV